MCSNFNPIPKPDFALRYAHLLPEFEYKDHVFPLDDAPILLAQRDELVPVRATFGLIPQWAKSADYGRRTYNARAETVATLPSYREAWRRRQRCLVPVRRFLEPSYETGRSVWWGIRRADDAPFLLAGIWETRRLPDARVQRSFSLLTIAAAGHPIMQRFHAPDDEKRTVVPIAEASALAWLGAESEGDLRDLLRPFPAEDYIAEPAAGPAPQISLFD